MDNNNMFNADDLSKFDDYIDQLAELVFQKIINKYGDIYPLNFVTDKEEILVAEVYICGNVFVFDEEELKIIEKCNNKQPCV